MAKKSNDVVGIDVSGGISRSGKRINTDIPEEERRRSSGAKVGAAKKRLKKTKEDSEARKKKRKDSEEEKGGVKKRRKRGQKGIDDDSEVIKKLKDKEKKKKKSKTKTAESVGEKRSKKRKRKTTGELLEAGKTKQVAKRLGTLGSKAVALADDVGITDVDLDILQGMVIPDNPSENDFMDEYKHIFGTLGNIIRKLEDQLNNPENKYVSSKDIYALMTMYSQMRETMADMRSITDMNEQAENLAVEVFDPAAKSSGESLVGLFFKINQTLRNHIKDGVLLEGIMADIKGDVAEAARKLQSDFEATRLKIVEVLNGG